MTPQDYDYPPRPRGYKGRHRSGRAIAPGFAPSGVISDRIRTNPDLYVLEADKIERANSDGRYDHP